MGLDTSNLFAKCTPALGTDIARNGTLTSCNIDFADADDLAGIYGSADGSYKILDTLLKSDFQGKVFGKVENGIYDWFNTNGGGRTILGGQGVAKRNINGRWEVEPFLKMDRRKHYNNNYWNVRVKSATTGPYNQTDNIDLYFYSQTGIPVNTNWFSAGQRVFISGKNAGSGDPVTGDTSYHLAFQIVSVTGTGSDSNGDFVEVVAAPQNAASAWLSNASSALQAKAKVPVTLGAGDYLGLGVRGTANVNDFEAHCSQIPALNNLQTIPFWIETNRYSIIDDELTQQYMEAIASGNPYYDKFGKVEQLEYNRQIVDDYKKRQAWSLFFNKPLNTNQTLGLWESLPQIVVPNASALALNMEGRCIGRKANAIGLYEQLVDCGRVVDIEGDTFDLKKFFNTLYHLKRNREGAGVPSDVIEVCTDQNTARKLARAIVAYYRDTVGDSFRTNYGIDEKKFEQGNFGFKWRAFNLDYPDVELRIVTNPFFDDLYSAHKAGSSGNAQVARFLWILDWTSIYKGVVDSNSVTNKSGDLSDIAKVDDGFMCVMNVPKRSVQLNSETFTMIVETENTSLVFENLGSAFDTADVDSEDAYLSN